LFGLNLYLHNSLHQTLNPKNAHSLIDPFLVVIIQNSRQGSNKLARSNHQFNKRQKELTVKKKKEQKRQHNLDKKNDNQMRIQINPRMKKRN